MSVEAFQTLIQQVTAAIAGKPLDGALEASLNADFPADGAYFGEVAAACREAIADGWMADREAGGIRFGRVIKPSPDLAGFSVDVVVMKDVAGPHHAHPKGEIDLIMPVDADATFDGHGKGWLVYGPGTAHRPTVGGGEAVVLYLLPDGAIDFRR